MTMSNGNDEWADVVTSFVQQSVPRMYEMGIRSVRVTETESMGVVPLDGNANHLDSMYAGTIFGVAEMTGGALAFAHFGLDEFYPTVKQVDLSFLKPVFTDLTARTSWTREVVDGLLDTLRVSDKAEYVVEIELIDANQVLVARAIGTYQVRRRATRE